jgi:hypothetical protein
MEDLEESKGSKKKGKYEELQGLLDEDIKDKWAKEQEDLKKLIIEDDDLDFSFEDDNMRLVIFNHERFNL